MVKVALWYGQSGALGHQSGTLVWSKCRFDVMQAHFWWTLKNDSSSLANSETKAPSKRLSKCLSKWRFGWSKWRFRSSKWHFGMVKVTL
jgi:hypothetical protein